MDVSIAESVVDVFRHPLVIVVIGAVISGLIISPITDRWQNRQKELQIRVNLVRRISRTIMGRMTKIELGVPAKRLEELNKESNDEYMKFKVDSAVIGTELDSYFPNQEIGKKWDELVCYI